jgi:hypothetical protein
MNAPEAIRQLVEIFHTYCAYYGSLEYPDTQAWRSLVFQQLFGQRAH